MKRITILSLSALVGLGVSYAQTPQTSEAHKSFQEFRNSIKKDFNDFRSRIKEQYADFLEGEWHPYEPLVRPDRDETPKPVAQPRMPEKPVASTPAPVPAPAPVPSVPVPAPVPVPTPAPVVNVPAVTPKPKVPAVEHTSTPRGAEVETFDFYGIPVEVGRVDFNILNNVSKPEDAGAQWRALQKGKATEAADIIDAKAKEMGLNGYLTFRLAEAYADSKFPNVSPSARMSLVHYLLVSMGYDARLALTTKGLPLILLPMEQTVYGSLYLNFDGRPYTAFAPEGTAPEEMGGVIKTCSLPPIKGETRKMDLRLAGLNLPNKPKSFDLKGGGIELKGEVNENIFRMIYRYPQMPTEDYAISVIDPELRKSIAGQVKAQLGDKTESDAVNSLLAFFHSLPYATDDQRHGFEKPYFLEETLYYDKCDCEDRAIMFTWLLWNALGIENQMIAYPGHESAAVHLRNTSPADVPPSYVYKDRPFWSADPTYIGAGIGDVMRAYTTTSPHIDLEYK